VKIIPDNLRTTDVTNKDKEINNRSATDERLQSSIAYDSKWVAFA